MALEEDLVFDLRCPGPCSGYLVSPDYPGRRSVTVVDAGEGYQRITVAKEDLKAYATAWLTLVKR